MAIYGKVVQVKLNTQVNYAPPKEGSYNGWKLVYEDSGGEVRTIAKAMASLSKSPTIREALESLQPGDDFTLVTQKNGQYNEIVSLAKGSLDASELPAVAPAKAVNEGTTVSSGARPVPARLPPSGYETPQERETKQRLIVRQSSVAQALTYLTIVGDDKLTAEKVFGIAEAIEAHVYRGL